MTLTITISLGNYCQNHCRYCVSGSGSRRWDPPVNWSTVSVEDKLDVSALDRWLSKFTPECRIHLSGGEPLCRPDVEDAVELLARRHRIVVYTNGKLILERPRLIDLPIGWLVTWHSSQVSLGEFVRQVEALRGKPVVVRSVLVKQEDRRRLEALKAALPWVEHVHGQWNLDPRKSWPDFKPVEADLDRIASEVVHLIVPWGGGAVFACNVPTDDHRIGSVHEQWYRPGLASEADAHAHKCAAQSGCSAYCDAVMMNKWFNNKGEK